MIKQLISSVLIAYSAIFLVACGGGDDYVDDVVYAISGTTDSASVTVTFFDGSIGQYDLPVPYKFLPLTFKCGEFMYLSAQNNRASGTITATIYVGGKVWKQVVSSGAYSIATVSGTYC